MTIMVVSDYLPQLSEAVARIIAKPNTPALIDALKDKLKQLDRAITVGRPEHLAFPVRKTSERLARA